jgi:hypothetical protein
MMCMLVYVVYVCMCRFASYPQHTYRRHTYIHTHIHPYIQPSIHTYSLSVLCLCVCACVLWVCVCVYV